jgi:hypothetical protein
MTALKVALGSFLMGAALSVAPIVAYAACDEEIWVQDDPSNCQIHHRYTLVGSNCDGDVCVCAYMRDEDSCPHIESGPCA